MRRRAGSLVNYLNHKYQYRKKRQEEYDLWNKHIKEIKNHAETQIISCKDYPDAFDYVNNLFPHRDVKQVYIFQVQKSVLKKYGLGFCGGFYDKIFKYIILAEDNTEKSEQNNSIWNSIKAEITKDEVIVHELLHYCFDQDGKQIDRNLEEEFAYGYSLKYLLDKGYNEDEIIKKNYFPYLLERQRSEIINNKIKNMKCKKIDEIQNILEAQEDHIFQKTCEKATEQGKLIIEIYKKKMNITDDTIANKDDYSINQFDLLDLED